ncbi:MAG TPA: adenylyl-sulfate kinase [Phycisphaerales bacterium]|nr:adenylyl-sulfate kinase [Phycisphaerales bacterium]
MSGQPPDRSAPAPTSTNITKDLGIDRAARWKALNTRGATILFTGLSGSGKSTIAKALESALIQRGHFAYRLDGDNVRHGLNADLGFAPKDRTENIRRLAEAAALLADAGAIALVSAIAPYTADRSAARAIHAREQLPFFEVFVDAPLAICRERDPKGLYRKSGAGELKGLTGVDAPYEAPAHPDLHLRTGDTSVNAECESLLAMLASAAIGMD